MSNNALKTAAIVFTACLAAPPVFGFNTANQITTEDEYAQAAESAKRAALAIFRNSRDLDSYNHPNRISNSIRGSGVHIRDGYLLTAGHVVTEMDNGKKVFAKEIRILTDNMEELTAKLVGASDFLDVAIYRADISKLSVPPGTAKFSEREPRPGESVFTVGYPLGRGPIMAFGRAGNTQTFLPTAQSRLMQIDVPECSGNSGGGLFNARGEIAGMVQSIITTGITDSVNEADVVDETEKRCSRYSFAVPGPIVSRIAESLIRGENPKFSKLGIEMNTVKLGDAWRIAAGNVTGPAEKAGFVNGDILLSIEDTPITSAVQLKSYLTEKTNPGDRKTIKVLRNGKENILTVTLGPS